MTAFEVKYRPVIVYADTFADLAAIPADLTLTKHAFILDNGDEYVLEPKSTVWQKLTDAEAAAIAEIEAELDANRIYNTASSAAVCSFSDGADGVPMKSLIAEIAPVQDLHGQEYPYPAGGGKNVLPLSVSNIKANNTEGTWSDNAYTQNGLTFTLLTNGAGEITGVNVNGTASANTNLILYLEYVNYPFNGYILNGCPSGGSNTTFDLRVSDVTTTSSTDTGSGVTTSLTDTGRWRAVIFIRSGVTVSNAVFKPMLRLSSVSDATFAPYSNICPISGWDGVTVTRCGKNLLDVSAFTTTTNKGVAFDLQSDGGIRVHGTATGNARVSVPISVKVFAGVAYTFGSVKNAGSVSGSDFNAGILGGTARTIGESTRSVTFTPSADQTYTEFAIFVATGTTVDNVIYPQLELGSTATSYAPYTGQTIPITLPGTEYGGSLDVISGELVVDRAIVTLDGTQNCTVSNSGTEHWYYNFTNVLPLEAKNTLSDISSLYPRVGISNSNTDQGFTVSSAWLRIRYGTEDTADNFKSWLSSNPTTFVYMIATPQTYQLDPVTITSLLKQNTIFADTGNTSAVYCADPKTYIDNAIASAVAALS